ncbi:sigma-70 family RNA polymerase sigma factor [soil metagenome]
MTSFIHNALNELTSQQVRFATPAKRREQLANAAKLINEIEPGRQYPYQFVCFRLTDFRSDAYPDLLIGGEDLKNDLALFSIQVERSLPPLPIEQVGEAMLTLEQVSEKFNVSTKTISRWRLRGLQARRVKIEGRSVLGFPLTSVEQFSGRYRDRVEKSAKFSHLSDAEKDKIILTARTMANEGHSLTDVSRRLATDLNRSAEAVRYTIKNFDRAHPELAVYPHRTGPLDDAAKHSIFTAMQQEGSAVDALTKKFNRSPSSLYRLKNEVQAKSLTKPSLDYMYNAEFDDPAKEAIIAGPMPDELNFTAKMMAMRAPKDVDAQMAYLYEKPLLSREQEAHLFRKMNFLKHKLHKLRQSIDPSRARVADLTRYEQLTQEVKAVRDLLIECNQRLVHNLATKHLQANQSIDELKSDANLSIMRAVEKFDYSRGNKFSTYATWAVMKNFARSIPDENTRRGRYVTGTDEIFEAKADVRTDEQEVVAIADAAKSRVNNLLEHLDPRTREVIRMRTGLSGGREMTLEQIGQHFGITKERVRQINVRGMKQLRDAAAANSVELP